MIEQTFLHLPGVGNNTERKLWKAGFRDWDALHAALSKGASAHEVLSRFNQRRLFDEDKPSTDRRTIAWLDCLDESRRALRENRYRFFLDLLKPSDHWRILRHVFKDALFLDIETTGLSQELHYATVIGALYQGRFYQWSWPEPLEPLPQLLESAPLIVTFNGKRFDVPFLASQAKLPEPRAHVDLLFLARALGLSGGQKVVEESLGLRRPGEFSGFEGPEAVAAWCSALYGSKDSYQRLLHYNRLDVELMPQLAAAVCNRLAALHTLRGETVHAPPAQVRQFRRAMPLASVRKTWIERRADLNVLAPKLIKRFGTSPTVVGIDLRAKEHRPTGWAICNGPKTDTKIWFTDDEIFEATIQAKPDLVSIDAPLFLPRGRQSVSDDSPCRAAGGIVRDAERILWSRRIPVYPALIRQMQGLTRRGIELAARLREHGIPVIESYPGAAQDILGIPRKKHDESLLYRGLCQFGFEVRPGLSHDELDAITSAMVGYFYFADEYEGIGADDEGYMIIPRWDRKMAWMPRNQKRVVALLGLPGSGKSTLSRALAQRLGWQYFAVGDALRTHAVNDVKLADDLARGELAPEHIVENLVHSAATIGSQDIVLDGYPRHVGQLRRFRELFARPSFLYLDLTPNVARVRLQNRACDTGAPRPEDDPSVVDRRLAYSKHALVSLIEELPTNLLIQLDGSLDQRILVDKAVERLLASSISE